MSSENIAIPRNYDTNELRDGDGKMKPREKEVTNE
jgi:hypothetical protein